MEKRPSHSRNRQGEKHNNTEEYPDSLDGCPPSSYCRCRGEGRPKAQGNEGRETDEDHHEIGRRTIGIRGSGDQRVGYVENERRKYDEWKRHLIIWHNVKARAPLPARAHVDHGVRLNYEETSEQGDW